MKKNLLIFCILTMLIIVLAACSSQSQQGNSSAVPTAAPTALPTVAVKNPDDLVMPKNIKFGMSADEVEKIETRYIAPKEEVTRLDYGQGPYSFNLLKDTADMSYTYTFDYSNGKTKLKHYLVSISMMPETWMTPIEDYNTIKSILVLKYGKETREGILKDKNTKKLSDELNVSFARGEFSYLTTWKTKDMKIELSCGAGNCSIDYWPIN